MRRSFAKILINKIRRKEQTIEDEMSFFDHLEVLRWHLIRSLAAVVVFALVAFLNKDILFNKILFGPKSTDFWTYRQLCKLGDLLKTPGLCVDDISFTIMNVKMVGQFTMHITSSLIAGIVLGFPYLAWELWRFIKPALHENERKHATGFVFYVSLLFGIGVLFGYFIFTPLSVSFLSNYIVSEEITNQYTLHNYLSTLLTLTLAAGLVFELPIVIYFLTRVGLITPDLMRKNRRYAIVVILVIAALITPTPDILTQLVVSTPLYLLFEMSIFVSARVLRKQQEREAALEERQESDTESGDE